MMEIAGEHVIIFQFCLCNKYCCWLGIEVGQRAQYVHLITILIIQKFPKNNHFKVWNSKKLGLHFDLQLK
jgi:hypothetical protein